MPDLWMPGATRMDVGGHGACDPAYPPKAIAHITWDRNATAAAPADLVPYETLRSYFGTNAAGRGVAPHLLWDPFTGRFAQFFPADSRSLSLVDAAGGTRTNRAGRVVLQIEALFFPYCRVGGKVFATLADTPCLGWDQLLAWVRSWGVPDTWPMGRPTDFTPHRSEQVWETTGGWYAHAHVPENDHQDPGSWPGFTTTVTEDPDMAFTADQARQLAELHDVLVPYAGWGYRNASDDAASVKAGNGHIPDAYGYLRGTSVAVQSLTAQVGGLTAALTALSTSGGLTAEQVTAAAQAGAAAALAELGDALTPKAG